MNTPKISVIVPVYNVEQYLPRCIESILAQTYNDFELLLINDGSSDNSGNICDEYAKNNSRVRVFHKENGGVSSARNMGLDNAQGEYVVFVDSDDFIRNKYLEILLLDWDKLPNKNGIVVQSNFRGHDDFWEENVFVDYLAPSKNKLAKAVEYGLLRNSEPHSKMFYLKIILDNNIKFPYNIKNGEDGIFIARYLRFIDCALLSRNSGYYYVEMPNSASRKLYSKEHEFESFITWKNELTTLFSIFDCKKYEFMWEMISVPLYRYIRVILQDVYLSTSEKNKLLNCIEKSITSNYGYGRSYSISGRLFKYLVNHRCFLVLTYLYKFKR